MAQSNSSANGVSPSSFSCPCGRLTAKHPREQSSLGHHPPCMWHDFIVEVHGEGHGPHQKLVVYEKAGPEGTGNENPRYPDGERKHAGLNNRSSTLHIWPWQGQADSRLMLEVDTDDGRPIQLPLLETAEESQWQDRKAGQQHILLPVVPFDWVKGRDIGGKSPTWPVLSRPGYFYVFRDARLWRELHITWEEGNLCFQDVRLDDYRDVNGRVTEDRRIPVGKALTDVWVPMRLDSTDIELEVAFSESPLPAARINRLQTDFSLRYDRCQQISQMKPHDTPADGAMIDVGPADRPVFYLDKVAAQRPRQPALEWQFERPWFFLENVAGTYPSKAYDMARDLFEQYEAGERTEPLQDYEKPEPGALALSIQQAVDESSERQKTRFFSSEDWQAQAAAADAIEPLRKRGVCGLKIDDRLYEIRHQAHRVETARELLALCSERARQHPQLESAQLVNQLILPSQFDGESNPLHHYVSALPSPGLERIERTLMTQERELGREYLDKAQDELLLCLRRQPYQQVLGDLFSSEGFDYAAAFRFAGRLVSLVLEPSIKQDPLHPQQGLPGGDSKGKQWLCSLCTEHEAVSQSQGVVSLARMLWPQADVSQQQTAYESPESMPDNPGDGVFRGPALARLETLNLPEDLSDIQTLEGFRLAAEIQAGGLTHLLFAGMAQGTKALNAAHNELHSAIRSALTALENNDGELKQLRAEYRQLNRQQAELTRRYEQKAQAALKTSEEEYLAVLKESREAHQQLERTRAEAELRLGQTQEALNQRFMARRLAMMSHPLEAVRQSMPTLLPGLRLMPLSDAIEQGKYVLGLEDLSAEGERVTPSTAKAKKMLAWILERDRPATQALSRLSQAQNELILARKAVEQGTTNTASAQDRLEAAQRRFNGITDELESLGARTTSVAAAIKATEQAIENNRSQLDQAENSRLYRLLNTPVLPMVVLGIEVVNVWNAYSSADSIKRERGAVRAVSGIFGSGYNAVVAATLMTERFANDLVKEKVGAVLGREFNGGVAKSLAEALGVKAITSRMFLGAIGGVAVTGISLSDTLYALETGDPAAWGYGVTTVSGVVMTMAAIIPAQATLLGMGPLGWIGLGLLLAGTALIWVLQDEPIENWLRNGPFGDHDGLPHLQGDDNAAEAYYRLLGQLMNLRLVYRSIPLTAPAQQAAVKSLNAAGLEAIQEATHIIRADSNLPGLLSAPEGIQALCKAQLLCKVFNLGRDYGLVSSKPVPDGEEQDHIILKQPTATGYVMLVRRPDSHRESRTFLGLPAGEQELRYEWQAKVQYQVTLKGKPFAFPAPSPKDTTRYDPKNDEFTKPDFTEDDQLFWVNGFAKPGSA
ncbi:ABC transporter permease [Marinobacter sp. R17]|uniref:ABC transporter permease n=1 Tax=Marinobacter sp. R17 TaxID=2484250 RepID=UPI001CC21C0D|nr:ABC transporter permease [Marinobacter sp. R17]